MTNDGYEEGWQAHARYLRERKKAYETGGARRALGFVLGIYSVSYICLYLFFLVSGGGYRNAFPHILFAVAVCVAVVAWWQWRRADRENDEAIKKFEEAWGD